MRQILPGNKKKVYQSRAGEDVKGAFLNKYSYFIDDRMAENVVFLHSSMRTRLGEYPIKMGNHPNHMMYGDGWPGWLEMLNEDNWWHIVRLRHVAWETKRTTHIKISLQRSHFKVVTRNSPYNELNHQPAAVALPILLLRPPPPFNHHKYCIDSALLRMYIS